MSGMSISADIAQDRRFSGIGRHGVMVAVVAIGVVLRVVAHLAYPYAFFYPDGELYVIGAYTGHTATSRPIGYSLLLAPFVPGNYIWVALAQHILVVAFAIVAYVYLLRRGVRPWVAGLALAPLLLGPTELILEHYVMAETVFTVATLGGLMALTLSARRPSDAGRFGDAGRLGGAGRPGDDGRGQGWRLVFAAVAGLLLAYAAVTRSVGLPVCALGLVYLLVRIRRVGWTALVTYLVATALPLLGYLGLYHHQHGVYAFGQFQGRFLYARTMTIADCAKLPADDQKLCSPTDPKDRWPRNEYFVFAPTSPATIYYPKVTDDKYLQQFALDVIKAQPLDYANMVVRETGWYFIPPLRPTYHLTVCANDEFQPNAYRNSGACGLADYVPGDPMHQPPKQPETAATPASRFLAAWGGSQIVYGPLTGLALLATLIIAVVRARRGDRVLLLDALLFAAASLGLLVASVALSMYELRYAIPSIPIAMIGLALAIRGARPVSGVAARPIVAAIDTEPVTAAEPTTAAEPATDDGPATDEEPTTDEEPVTVPSDEHQEQPQ